MKSPNKAVSLSRGVKQSTQRLLTLRCLSTAKTTIAEKGAQNAVRLIENIAVLLSFLLLYVVSAANSTQE